jgi:8-oxo-dGTP diphosphatase
MLTAMEIPVTAGPWLVLGVVLGALLPVVAASAVLLLRRRRGDSLAGHWELPGGKVDAGESLEDAAVREVAEELGCRVRVTGRLNGVEPVAPGLELRVVTAELLDGAPTPTEHDALRWLALDELGDVDWLAPDVPFLDELRARWHEWGEERT